MKLWNIFEGSRRCREGVFASAHSHKSVLKCRNSNKLITHCNSSTQCKWRSVAAGRVRKRKDDGARGRRAVMETGNKQAGTIFFSIRTEQTNCCTIYNPTCIRAHNSTSSFTHWDISNGNAENNHTKWPIANMLVDGTFATNENARLADLIIICKWFPAN